MKKIKLLINKENEILEISHFLTLSTLTPLVWYIFFNLGAGDLISNNDGAHLYRLFDHMTKYNLSGREYSYDLILHGGTETWSKIGISWFQELLVSFGFSAANILNTIIISIQIWISYFSLQFIKNYIDIDKLYIPKRLMCYLITVLVISFAPYLFWRFSNGHIYFLFGMISFLAYTSLIFNFYKKNITLVCLILSFIALTISIPTNGQQLVIYFLYGAVPLVFLDFKKLLKPIFLASITGLAALLFSYSSFHSLLEHFIFDNIPRSSTNSALIYSYTTQNIWDFINGLFFEPYIINQRSSFFILHETNYPLGPYFVVLLLFGITRKRLLKHKKLIAALSFSFIIQHLFAHNIWPINDIISSLPMMKAFRVPARFIMLSCYFLSVITTIIVIKELIQANFLLKSLPIIVLSYLVVRNINFSHGILIYFILFSILALYFKAKINFISYLLSIFIGLSLSYSELRLYPFVNTDLLSKTATNFHRFFNIPHVDPYHTPIKRTESSFYPGETKLSHINLNSAYTLDLPSFSGAQHVSPRTDILLSVLTAQEPGLRASILIDYIPNQSIFSFFYNIKNYYGLDKSDQKYQALIEKRKKKINQNTTIDLSPDNSNISVYRKDNRFNVELETDNLITSKNYNLIRKVESISLGPSWFPTAIKRYPDIISLFTEIKNRMQQQRLDTLESDLLVTATHELSNFSLNPKCSKSTFKEAYIDQTTNTIHYKGTSPQECIMVIPFNYSPKMILKGLSHMGLAYGILTYIKIPKGEWNFSISFDETISPKDDFILKLLGLFLLLLTARFLFINKDQTLLNKEPN